jgi:thiol-disulfide isomerase/thioredoxin
VTIRLLLALGVVAAAFLAYALWTRPPRRLSRLDLASLGLGGPAIVQFSTRSCGPCRTARPHLERAAARMGLAFLQVDVGERPEVARRYGIRRVPTIAVAGPTGRVLRVWSGLPGQGELAAVTARAVDPTRAE